MAPGFLLPQITFPAPLSFISAPILQGADPLLTFKK